MSRRCRSAGRVGRLAETIFRSMSSDMRRMRRCARLNAVPPPNTSRNGAVSTATIAAECLDDIPVFFDQGRTRQAEVLLDFEQILKRWVIAQGPAPDCRHGAAGRNAPSPARPD